MLKIEIKNRWTNLILFEYSKENNTIKETVIEAAKNKSNLRGAYLRGVDLRGSDLQGVYLEGSNLQRSNLQGANLQGADLRGSDLREADLQGSNLQEADLRGAYLQGAYLQGFKIKKTAVFTGLYKYIAMPIISEDDKHYIRLGCYTRLVSEWENNFWNNEFEFLKKNELGSQYRVMAYDFCKQWIELNK
jgi:hypothetical protein